MSRLRSRGSSRSRRERPIPHSSDDRPACCRDRADEASGEPEITALLQSWQSETTDRAFPELMEAVTDDLRRLARAYFSRERPGHTLEPTALVHEVYLRLSKDHVGRLADRKAFFSFAARLMRQILVDHARARMARKRGGEAERVAMDEAMNQPHRQGLSAEEMLSLDDALRRLGEIDERQRRVVELRYFAGLTVPEVADLLGVSRATVERDWSFSRRWLAREIATRDVAHAA